jgi:5'-nucleotidase
MRILLTNDDGIGAEGLACLERIASRLSDDVWIVAPEVEQSGASRAITFSEPVRVRTLGPRRFAVSGTPTDCVVLAVSNLIEGPKPDLVLSGVNRGANMGEDISMSGTVAGALEGMVLGIPSIALSQEADYTRVDHIARFETAEAHAPGVIARLIELGWPKGVVMNLNFPDLPPGQVHEVEVTRQGFRDIHDLHAERRTDLRGRDYYWMGFFGRTDPMVQGTDLAALALGRISVTPVHIDLTHLQAVHELKKALGGATPVLKPAAG